ncbi:MAG TPA: DUF6338 family protein [Longimicrobium sp.]|nr:DUF6338 family protein [Longimicrobium sp.]
MELSSLTLRVLLLFFPGVLCALLVDALTVHRERTPAQFLTHAFALGMGSYLSLGVLRDVAAAFAQWLHLRQPLEITFFDALVNDRLRLAWGEIALAALVAVLLSAMISAAVNRRTLLRVGNRLTLTRKTGELDVWSFLFNSPAGTYVVVRDLPEDLAYAGTVEVFSDTSSPAELLLKNVEVFQSSTLTKLYEAERVYLARDPTKLVIEPARPPSIGGPDA